MTHATAPNPLPSSEPQPAVATTSRGRPGLLDEAARNLVVTLLARGNSRRVVANFLGCAPSTITRTAERDPQFAAEVARAQQAAQVRLIDAVNNAANQERYWRAAAWLLERINPEDFMLRAPDTYTALEVVQITGKMARLIASQLPEQHREMVAENLDAVLQEFAAGVGRVPAAGRRGKAGHGADFCNAPPPGDMELTSSADGANAAQQSSCG